MTDLVSILADGVSDAGPLDFGIFRREVESVPFNPGALAQPETPPAAEKYLPPALSGIHSLLPWERRSHAEATAAGMRRFDDEVRKHAEREIVCVIALAQAKRQHDSDLERAKEEADSWNAKADDFARDYREGVPLAVTGYCQVVLEQSDYPKEVTRTFRVAYVPESRQVVVEMDLPLVDVIPDVSAYKFVKSKRTTTHTLRSASQRRAAYASLVAQITLRTLHEIFAADRANYVDSIVFNGHVNAIAKGTGQPVHPCVVTVRTTRVVFSSLNLANVDPQACLKTLSASVSPSPSELVAVRPVLEFNMVDPRFVDEADVLSALDQRPNLMELTPTEFESLITNLFEKMGLETRQTQASRDGGVDCVAYDNRPIFGGKVVIQAKRYKHTVGVSAVRDLFGTLQNEGASKGILVTTSGYGKAAFDFAAGKPLELLEGSHLLYLLEQHAGMKAKIVVPEDWRDPLLDIAEGL